MLEERGNFFLGLGNANPHRSIARWFHFSEGYGGKHKTG